MQLPCSAGSHGLLFKKGETKHGCQGDYDDWVISDGSVPEAVVLPADFDGNGIVDLTDFAVLAGNWLMCTDPEDPDCTP